MNMDGEWTPQTGSENQYTYNSKELNEDLGIDYGWRWYNASIGRWNAIDPLAELYHKHSGYHYVLNNPILFIDPDGTNAYVRDTETGNMVQVGDRGGNETDYVYDGKITLNDDGEVSEVAYSTANATEIAVQTEIVPSEQGALGQTLSRLPGINIIGGGSSQSVESVENPVEFLLEIPKKAAVKSALFLFALIKSQADDIAAKVTRITVIGKMDDVAGYTDDVFDTWHKSGRIPSRDGGGPVSWAENKAWLDEKITRGDAFWIATDPRSLPKVKGGYIPGKPNGYFTARELSYLREKGISVLFHKPK